LMAFVAYDASAYPWMLCICNDLYMAHRHYSFVYVRNLWRRGKGVEEFRRGAIAGMSFEAEATTQRLRHGGDNIGRATQLRRSQSRDSPSSSFQDGNNCVTPPTLRSSPGGAAGGLTTKPPIYILDTAHTTLMLHQIKWSLTDSWNNMEFPNHEWIY